MQSNSAHTVIDFTRTSTNKEKTTRKRNWNQTKDSRRNVSVYTKTKAQGFSWLTLLISLTLCP